MLTSPLFFFFFFLVLPVYCYQPISLHPHAHMLSHVIPWTSAHQTLSMDFSRQEYWSELPFPSPSPLLFTNKCYLWYCYMIFFYFVFFSLIFIRWRLITLHYCNGFCHTLTWISHGFICVPHPDPPSCLPVHPIPLGLPSALALSTCLMHPTWLVICFTLDSILVSVIFSLNIPPSPSPTVLKSVLYICVSFSVLHKGLSLPSF